MTATPITGPITCQPWCKDRGTPHEGHGDEAFAEDQRCTGESLRTVQSLEPKWEDIVGRMHPREVEIFLTAYPGQPSRVVIYEGDSDTNLELTPAEARRIGKHLMTMAAQAEAR